MLTVEDLKDALSSVRYKPNFGLSIWEPDELQGPYLFIGVQAVDANGECGIELRIQSPIPPMLDYESFYRWVLWRLKMVEIHECMEFFKVDGKHYIDPHRPL